MTLSRRSPGDDDLGVSLPFSLATAVTAQQPKVKSFCTRIDFFRARKWPTITASDISNAPTAWDTQSNTQYHTPDANMTSLSIRMTTVPRSELLLSEVSRGQGGAQRAAVVGIYRYDTGIAPKS